MNIVCGTDFSDEARRAAEAAGAIAKRLGGTLHLVHALELPTVAYVAGDVILFPPSYLEPDKTKLEAGKMLATEARRIGDLTKARIEHWLDIGGSDSVILDAAKRFRANLVVVGTHGRRAPMRWILGSTAERVVAASPAPVLVMRGESEPFLAWSQERRTLRMLVAADFDESFVPAAREAAAFTAGTEIHIAHACEIPSGGAGPVPYAPALPIDRVDLEARSRAELRRRAAEAGMPAGSDSLHVVWGRPASAIAGFAKDGRFDVLVCGTHGRRGLERALVGSVAHGLLRRSAMPVLIAPVT